MRTCVPNEAQYSLSLSKGRMPFCTFSCLCFNDRDPEMRSSAWTHHFVLARICLDFNPRCAASRQDCLR